MPNEGTFEEYLSLHIEHGVDESFRVSQPILIDRIIEPIRSMINAHSFEIPASSGSTLTKDINSEPRKGTWNYRSVVGILRFLMTCSYPELPFTVHQCARFSNHPMYFHEQDIKCIARYLIGTNRGRNKTEIIRGILYRPNKRKSIETYVDASFASEWNVARSDKLSSVMFRTGYVV